MQAKLAIGATNDPLEQEADRIADQVLAAPANPAVSSAPPRIQRIKGQSSKHANRVPVSVHRVLAGPGKALDSALKQEMEERFGHDFSRVRVHSSGAAEQSARDVNANAYTAGHNIVFGAGRFVPRTHDGRRLIAHELAHVVQQTESGGTRVEQGNEKDGSSLIFENGAAPVIQRKEVEKESDIQGKQDWTTADRNSGTKRWQSACETNLNAVDSSQYVKVVERRDFYKWFYKYTADLGYSTRWALAAYVVANGAHQIVDMDADHSVANDLIGLANVELQGAMREGNQVIFDNVLPKLKKLLDGGPLKGPAALKWDMQVLAEEQTLIQPMYSRMSTESVEQLDYIARKKRFAGLGAWWTDDDKVGGSKHISAGTVPGFDQPSIKSVGDRWRYGMNIGDKFTPGGTGFDPKNYAMPAISTDYVRGSEFTKVDTHATLHELDAWLNPNRVSRVGPGSNILAIVNKLSGIEKQQVLSDRSPDGWAYSIQFAQFSFITEALVQQALPSEPVLGSTIAAFLARYKAERARLQKKYPVPPPMYGPKI